MNGAFYMVDNNTEFTNERYYAMDTIGMALIDNAQKIKDELQKEWDSLHKEKGDFIVNVYSKTYKQKNESKFKEYEKKEEELNRLLTLAERFLYMIKTAYSLSSKD